MIGRVYFNLRVHLLVVQDDVRIQAFIVADDPHKVGVPASPMLQQRTGEMMPAKAPRRRCHPEVPISEAAHVDSISTDRLAHLASKHRAVGELVEVLQSPQVEMASDPDSLEIPKVLAIRLVAFVCAFLAPRSPRAKSQISRPSQGGGPAVAPPIVQCPAPQSRRPTTTRRRADEPRPDDHQADCEGRSGPGQGGTLIRNRPTHRRAKAEGSRDRLSRGRRAAASLRAMHRLTRLGAFAPGPQTLQLYDVPADPTALTLAIVPVA
jgi:hypothetical protein